MGIPDNTDDRGQQQMKTAETPRLLDPTRPLVCKHGNRAEARPIPTRPGWWQNFAIDCVTCQGDKHTGIPYQPPVPPTRVT
ncbi:hypothetical protein LCGC14_0274010 [marine sediment metagenome]|uniref:Uncharacterized protein n=1 Tax=marine sediment metagenome TaxID=412755 RepID=A0A0F9U353_9ZZZZ